MKNIILDSQVLNSLMACARLTDFRFNLNLTSIKGKSNSLEVGSIVHIVLEYYHKAMIDGKNRVDAIEEGMKAGHLYIQGCQFCTTDEIPEHKAPCGHKWNEFPGLKNTPPDSDRWIVGYNHALKTCEEYFNFYKSDAWITLEAEKVKQRIIYDDGEIRVMWKAKLDRTVDTNQGIFPVDVKTMKQRRDETNLNNQFIGQCIVSDTRSMIVDRVGFQTSLKPNEKFTREVMSFTKDRLEEWTQEIVPYYAQLLLMYTESGYWPPNWSHCDNKYGKCEMHGICSSDRSMREEELRINFIKRRPWDVTNED